MPIQPVPVLMTSAGVPNMVTLISEYGIQVIICAIMMLIMWKLLNNLIKRDNKLFEELSPRISELEHLIKETDQNMSNQISSHNAHANQFHHNLEKDQADIRALLLEGRDQLQSISGQLTVLTSKLEVLTQITSMMQYNGGRPPGFTHMIVGDTTEEFHGKVDHYNIHPETTGEHTKNE